MRKGVIVMNEPISEMNRQLRDAPPVNLLIAIQMNKAKRNAYLFSGTISAAVVLLFSSSKWWLLIPTVLGIGSLLYHMNVITILSEIKRRSKES